METGRPKKTREMCPYWQTWNSWAKSKTDEDFRQMVMRGVLHRGDMAAECGFSKSVLVQNELIAEDLERLEDDLRARGILPPKVTQPVGEDGEFPMRQSVKGKAIMDDLRMKRLEDENASLKAEIKELKDKLARYGLLEEALAETGRIPR